MEKLEKILKLYDYHLPPELIAQEPAKPRDSARLLVYSRRDGKVRFDTFKNLGKYLPRTNFTEEGITKSYRLANQTLANKKLNSKKLVRGLPKNSVLIFNQTKVWPARLVIKKPTGGKVEMLYISHDKNFIKVLANRKLSINSKESFFLGRPFGKAHPSTSLGVTLSASRTGQGALSLSNRREKSSPESFTVAKKVGQFYFLKPSFPLSQVPKILKRYGITPLPPYIKHSPLTEKQKREEYQSVFAKAGLSVAAPTASLHFTKRLMKNLQKQGIDIKFVQLDVGLGTFAPLKEDNIKTGKLHREYYQIDKTTAQFLNLAKEQGRPIIAVGTTVVRTLESAAKNRGLTKLTGDTNLFIQENYKFKFVDGIITNFHVPKSSLLMLVSSFVGRKTVFDLYKKAIKKQFRFFSFGDGMLIV